MNHTIEEVSNTRRKFKIVVPKTTIEETIKKTTNELQTKAEIKGFRKGKAPVSLVQKIYMGDIIKKTADKVIQSAYETVAKSSELQIVSQPHIDTEKQFDPSTDFEFSATVDINPKVDMHDYKNISVKLKEALNINVEDEMNRQLEKVAASIAKQKNGENAEPLPIDDDFAKNLGYATIAEAKEKIAESIKNMNAEAKASAAYEQLVDHILAKNTLEVPESLIDSTIDKLIAAEHHHHDHSDHSKCEHPNPEDLEVRNKYKDEATRQVHSILALGHIARQEGVTVSDNEVIQNLMAFAQSNGIHPNQLVKQAGVQIYNELRGQVMLQKTINRLLELAQVEYEA